MHIVLTGATGFVGRYLVPLLLKRGHTVTVLVRNAEKLARFDWHSQVRVLSFDLMDEKSSLPDAFDGQDVLVHLAWAGLPNYQSLIHIEENLPASYRFIKAAVLAGIQQVLVTGTCLEYGIQSGCLSADGFTNPSTAYAVGKDSLRRFLETLQKEIPFALQWARLFYVYGEGQHPHSLFSQLNQAIERGEKTFRMSGGEQVRDFLPIEDAAKQLVDLIEMPRENGCLNICSGEGISVREMVERIVAERSAEIELDLGYYPYPDYEPMMFWGKRD